MVTSVTKGTTQKWPKKVKILEITIHWKALAELILMVPLVFAIHFQGENAF
jgi:hypothetical protein